MTTTELTALREKLARDTAAFIAAGGSITALPQGHTGDVRIIKKISETENKRLIAKRSKGLAAAKKSNRNRSGALHNIQPAHQEAA
jgi:hypothetical protein